MNRMMTARRESSESSCSGRSFRWRPRRWTTRKSRSRPPMERIEVYEKLIGAEKDSVELLFKLGNAYYDAEMGDMAASFYRRSVVAGGDSKVVINLAFVLDDLGKRDEAYEAYRDGIRRWPEDAVLRAFYGDYLAADPDTAAGILRRRGGVPAGARTGRQLRRSPFRSREPVRRGGHLPGSGPPMGKGPGHRQEAPPRHPGDRQYQKSAPGEGTFDAFRLYR